jgi:hypothetical protein
MTMQGLTRISIAVVCALAVTAAIAQTVQPRGATPAEARPPLQTAQAPAAGGAASGASTAAAGGAGGATLAGTVVYVGIGVAAVAGSMSGSGSPAVTHNP